MGTRPRWPDRLPRRLRPRRGGHPGGVRDRGRALAAGGRAREPGRLADDDGAKPRHQPHPARADVAGEDPAAPGRGEHRGHDGRHRLSRRAPRARVHLLPPGARDRGAGRAHVADARRPLDARDRPRLPGAGGDDGPAPGARQGEDPHRGHPLPCSAGSSAARPPDSGARRRLPDLQPGLQGPHRARRRGDPPRTRARAS